MACTHITQAQQDEKASGGWLLPALRRIVPLQIQSNLRHQNQHNSSSDRAEQPIDSTKYLFNNWNGILTLDTTKPNDDTPTPLRMRCHNKAAMNHTGKALRRNTQRLRPFETQELPRSLACLRQCHAGSAPRNACLGRRRLRHGRLRRSRLRSRLHGGWLVASSPVERSMLTVTPQHLLQGVLPS